MTALPTQRKAETLRRKMAGLGIAPHDLHESFARASGPGGQHVNKSSTAVFLKHLPTGITVKCGETRSQGLNRFLALRNLIEKIEDHRRRAFFDARNTLEKLRRQRRRPSRKAQAARLREKTRHSEKKHFRQTLKGASHD